MENQWTLATIGLDFKRCEAPIQLVQGILQRLGLKMPCLGQKGDGRKTKRFRVYGAPVPDFVKVDGKPLKDSNGFAIPLDDGREEIFKQWEIRDLDLRNKKLEDDAKVAQELQQQSLAQEEANQTPDWVLEQDTQECIKPIYENWEDAQMVGMLANGIKAASKEIFERLIGFFSASQFDYVQQCMAIA